VAEQEARRQAAAHNAELGAAAIKHLSRLKVDARVIKILTAVDIQGDLQRVATRGARYGFPGWSTTVEQKNGKTKTEYPGPNEAATKAREFLSGAHAPAELAGRCICLITMARYADENAIAASQRSFYQLHVGTNGVPWGADALDLLDELAAERLPEHLTQHVREDKERRRREAEEAERARRKRQADVEALLEGLPDMSDSERSAAVEAFEREHGMYTPERWEIKSRLDELVATQASPADDEASKPTADA
jgi:hypothetical protein